MTVLVASGTCSAPFGRPMVADGEDDRPNRPPKHANIGDSGRFTGATFAGTLSYRLLLLPPLCSSGLFDDYDH